MPEKQSDFKFVGNDVMAGEGAIMGGGVTGDGLIGDAVFGTTIEEEDG